MNIMIKIIPIIAAFTAFVSAVPPSCAPTTFDSNSSSWRLMAPTRINVARLVASSKSFIPLITQLPSEITALTVGTLMK